MATISTSPVSSMRAMTYVNYGAIETVLSLKTIPAPVARAGEVLVRVRAAGVHIGDCFGVRGAPYLMRAETGLLKPRYGIPGFDFAGIVESTGEGVTEFRPGDEVFGASHATCAEYVRSSTKTLALKPAGLTFEEAAVIPTSGLAALHGLRDAGKVQAGQRVLINGASGGVGTFEVQIARSMGAEVTGVCGTKNVDLVRSLGADHVIDYSQEDFTKSGKQYDVIFDNVENRSLADIRRALTPTGTLVLNSGTGAKGIEMFVRLVRPLVLSPFARQNLRRYLSKPNHQDLVVLKDLAESGKLRPVIDQTFALEDTAKALKYVETGHVAGKVVVTV